MDEKTFTEEGFEEGGAAKQEATQEEIFAFLEESGALRPLYEGVIEYCAKPRTPGEVDALYGRLTEHNICTFSPVRVRAMLEEAGALAYIVDEAGAAAESDTGVEPPQPDEPLYEIAVPEEGLWRSTPAALSAVEARDKVGDTVFAMEAGGGLSAAGFIAVLVALEEGAKAIDDLESMMDRAFAGQRQNSAAYFVHKLEESGAVSFEGKWALTDSGREALMIAEAGR